MQLPPELILSIFNILAAHHDWDTLRACSLISSSYSAAARQHLFSTVKLKFRIRNNANYISIKDIVRRVQGLCQLLQRDPDTNRFIKTLEILDSYPVYDSQWITEQSCLPRFLSLLENVQSCTFGCEVGHLSWSFFSPDLQTSLRKLFFSPRLKTLILRNLDSVPEVILRNPIIRYLYLDNVSAFPSDLLVDDIEYLHDGSQRLTANAEGRPADNHLVYLNIRTVSVENTETVSRLLECQGKNLKIIKWRCWEDPRASFAATLPGFTDIDIPPSIRKLSFRLSFGNMGLDLTGLCRVLDSASQPLKELRSLEITILFPNQSTPHRTPEIHKHKFWSQLATVLKKAEYSSLRHLSVHLTIRRKVQTGGRHEEDSVAEFRKQMKHALRHLSNMSTLQLKFKVDTFNRDG